MAKSIAGPIFFTWSFPTILPSNKSIIVCTCSPWGFAKSCKRQTHVKTTARRLRTMRTFVEWGRGNWLRMKWGRLAMNFPICTMHTRNSNFPLNQKKISRLSVSSPPICQSGLTFRSPLLNEPMFLPSQLSLVSLHWLSTSLITNLNPL
jgi:hypothetical protein